MHMAGRILRLSQALRGVTTHHRVGIVPFGASVVPQPTYATRHCGWTVHARCAGSTRKRAGSKPRRHAVPGREREKSARGRIQDEIKANSKKARRQAKAKAKAKAKRQAAPASRADADPTRTATTHQRRGGGGRRGVGVDVALAKPHQVFARGRGRGGRLKAPDPAYSDSVTQRCAVFPLQGMVAVPPPNLEQRQIAAKMFQRPPVFLGTEATEIVEDELPNRLEVRHQMQCPPRLAGWPRTLC